MLGLHVSDFHPLGLVHGERISEACAYGDVLAARADRDELVRSFLAAVTDEVLNEERPNPHNPADDETVRSCLHVILVESWEHLRFALRDLDTIKERVA